jgi:hypothetical protein
MDDVLTGTQISMGISDEDDLSLGGEMDKSRFSFEYLSNFKKVFLIHPYSSAFITLT